MTAISNDDVVIPPMLEEMANIIVNPEQTDNERHRVYLDYVLGWVTSRGTEEYKELLKRDGIPEHPGSLKLLCELAIMRALVRWHEVRDRPPPMPSIDEL